MAENPTLGARISPTNIVKNFFRKKAGKKAFLGSLDAFRASEGERKKALEERNRVATERFGESSTLRGGLIDAQRGGLASTILNLGGARGDPTKPFAAQMIGSRATAGEAGNEALALEKFKFDSAGEASLVAQYARSKKKKRFF